MTPRKVTPQLKLLIDGGPLLAFFAVVLWKGLLPATAVLMVATLIALIASYAIERRIALMPLVTAGFVGVFGGLSLWLHDTYFLKIKPTIVYLLFATALLGGQAFGRSLLKPLFEMAYRLTDAGWRILTLRWGFFFIAMAIFNEVARRYLSDDWWAAVKTFGFLSLTVVFAAAQIRLLQKYALPEEPKSS